MTDATSEAAVAEARMFAPTEEAGLSEPFGPAWDQYYNAVKIPWL
ncbi:MAG TPA: hypothetical protein VLE71_05695 [Actinomycetota bacterium]|nr:hypothetical protein [Actinomycetota bacterium]